MNIIRQDPFTGQTNAKDIDVTESQIALWESGTLIQHAMPELSPSDREFIMTGITTESWDLMTGNIQSVENNHERTS